MDLAFNNLQKLICHKPKQLTNQPTEQTYQRLKTASKMIVFL